MKKKKQEFHDDGHTVADMNVEGFRWYENKKDKKKRRELSQLDVTKAERRAMIKAAFKVYTPIFLVLAGGMVIAYWLLYFLMKYAA